MNVIGAVIIVSLCVVFVTFLVMALAQLPSLSREVAELKRQNDEDERQLLAWLRETGGRP